MERSRDRGGSTNRSKKNRFVMIPKNKWARENKEDGGMGEMGKRRIGRREHSFYIQDGGAQKKSDLSKVKRNQCQSKIPRIWAETHELSCSILVHFSSSDLPLSVRSFAHSLSECLAQRRSAALGISLSSQPGGLTTYSTRQFKPLLSAHCGITHPFLMVIFGLCCVRDINFALWASEFDKEDFILLSGPFSRIPGLPESSHQYPNRGLTASIGSWKEDLPFFITAEL